MGVFFRGFNRAFTRITEGYVTGCAYLIPKVGFAMLLLVAFATPGWLRVAAPTSFLPQEDQGYFYLNVQLPVASFPTTDERGLQTDRAILKETPGWETNMVVGFSMLSFRIHLNGFSLSCSNPGENATRRG